MQQQVDLRQGRWQDVLANVSAVDSLIGDPPYSARTHEGQRTGSGGDATTIDYEPITRDDCFELARCWERRVAHWMVLFCDHVSFLWHEEAWRALDWLTFAPVQWVKPDAAPRKQGDGPNVSIEPIFIARRRGAWAIGSGSRKGYYECPTAELRGGGIAGAKPLPLMRALVRDYSEPGHLIVDPFSGSATTLVAAGIEGRRAVGAEEQVATYEMAVKRLAKGWTLAMPLGPRAEPMQQRRLM